MTANNPAPVTAPMYVVPAKAPPTVLASRTEAEFYVASVCFKHGPPHLVGAELEWVVQYADDPRRPIDPHLLAALLGPHAPPTISPRSPWSPLPGGSPITIEPGGQVEISSPPVASLSDLVDVVETDMHALEALLAPAGLCLVHRGADPSRPSCRVLDAPRYAAMEAAFDRIGAFGRQMMCSTAAVQVSVDAGEGDQVAARWAALHDIGPALVGAFANSPVLSGARSGWRSSRMRAWFDLDPVRTRPRPVHADPAADWARRALDTPLLCRRRRRGSWAVPSGVTFAAWLDGALPGPPTTADLDYHLTTLFPPVRPQGHLEVRYLDTQPAGQWAVPAAVVTALLADDAAVDTARDLAAPTVGRWVDGARVGLADPELRRAAVGLFELACARLPGLDAPASLLQLVEEITECRVRRGRCPADDPDPTAVASKELS